MWTVASVSVEGDSQEPQGVYLIDNVAIEADWRDGPVVFVTRNLPLFAILKARIGSSTFQLSVPGC